MDEALSIVMDMDREQLESLLRLYGFIVYEWEDDTRLRQSVKTHLFDGTIPVDEVLPLTW